MLDRKNNTSVDRSDSTALSSIVKIIPFMRGRKIAFWLSVVLMVVALASLITRGITWGLDFTGGTLVEFNLKQEVPISTIRSELLSLGYKDTVVQSLGTSKDILIRLAGDNANDGHKLATQLNQVNNNTLILKRVEYVGPQVGGRLKQQGGLGMLLAVVLVMLYIAFRFQFKFSVGVVVSLIHDIIFVMGFFSFFDIQFNLTAMAAVLAVIGYSLNDTIIVFDRIRENFRKQRKLNPTEIIDLSLSQTLGRTLATSGTTLMVLVALFLFGGSMIHNFALALILGVVAGTYSSVYVASSLLLNLNIDRRDLLPPEVKGVLDDRP